MQKFYEKIVNNSKNIIIIFGIIFLIYLFLMPLVSVNYDINDYLPSHSSSTVSLEIMESEFSGGIPKARVMIENVTLYESLEYKRQIEKIDGVSEVLWLDDSVDISIPLEAMDTKTVENYYKNGSALYTVTLEDDKRIEAVDAIRNLIGYDNAMSGADVSTAVSTESTLEEVPKIAVIGVIFTFIILILTTGSWAEPFIVLIGLGAAVVINSGTNLIFGEISFVTNAAGNILQLAISLDYFVFLIHRFTEYRKNTSNEKEAMVMALIKSTSSIFSSGVTTVIGFLALAFMEFRIGPDLGFALAKGIGISLITVFVLMPPIILSTYKFIDKTEHRPFLPSFGWFGKLITKLVVPMICIFVILIVPSFLASKANDFYYGSSNIFGEGTKFGTDTQRIESTFGKRDTYVLLVPKGNSSNELMLSNELKKLPQVTDIISYVDTVGLEIPVAYLSDKILSKLESNNYRRIVISLDVDFEGEETFALIEEIRKIAGEYYPDSYYLAGEGVSTYDLMKTVTDDMVKVNVIAIGAVFVVLLFALKSITLPFILILCIQTAIWINLSIPYFNNSSIFYIAYLIISSIQLGATVDYAILLTDRYLENRKAMNKRRAVIDTISSVTISILTSGSVLTIVGFVLGNISTHGILSQLGIFLGKGTLSSMIIVFFVLPGMLFVLDKFIERTTKGTEFLNDKEEL